MKNDEVLNYMDSLENEDRKLAAGENKTTNEYLDELIRTSVESL